MLTTSDNLYNVLFLIEAIVGLAVWRMTTSEAYVYRRNKLIWRQDVPVYTFFVLFIPRCLTFIALGSIVVFSMIAQSGLSVAMVRRVVALSIASVFVVADTVMFLPWIDLRRWRFRE